LPGFVSAPPAPAATAGAVAGTPLPPPAPLAGASVNFSASSPTFATMILLPLSFFGSIRRYSIRGTSLFTTSVNAWPSKFASRDRTYTLPALDSVAWSRSNRSGSSK
jgi:hypothetical protein